MEALQGRDSRSETRCEARQRDRPCFLAGDTRAVAKMQRGSSMVDMRTLRGRQAQRGGDSP